jgi:hypothetical protein
MDIGNCGDGELKIGGPSRRQNVITRDTKPIYRLDAEAIRRCREAGGGEASDGAEEVTA